MGIQYSGRMVRLLARSRAPAHGGFGTRPAIRTSTGSIPSIRKWNKRPWKRPESLRPPYRNLPQLIGYFSDNEVGWWNSSLFIWFLKAPWENHTKRFLWKMIYDSYEGNWEAFLADWSPQGGARDFEDLKKAGASLKLRPGGNGIRLVDRFMSACAKRYYELMYRAIHTAHPGALVLGDRLPLYYHQDAILAMGDNVDVISTNYNVDIADGWVAPYFFDGLAQTQPQACPGKRVLFCSGRKQERQPQRNRQKCPCKTRPSHDGRYASRENVGSRQRPAQLRPVSRTWSARTGFSTAMSRSEDAKTVKTTIWALSIHLTGHTRR